MSEATRYVLFYETGPNYPADAVTHFPAHRARWAGFMDRGVLLMIGPFADGEAGAMGVFKSRETAEEFAGEDPFVLNGVVGKWHVREWRAVSPDG